MGRVIDPLKRLILRLLPTQKRFELIYSANQWNSDESVSGPGSESKATEALRRELPRLIRELRIESILDAPCGDFNWMEHVVDEVQVRYTGLDIVRELICQNNDAFASDRIEFIHGNIITGPVPRADLIICRDCFIHLSFRDAARAIEVFKASGSKYLLASNRPHIERNEDITTGGWRAMNLALPPYNYPEPILKIQETRPGKEMCLWDLAQL